MNLLAVAVDFGGVLGVLVDDQVLAVVPISTLISFSANALYDFILQF